jgi:predicted GIY-YIG superfamily endonuclease
MKHTRAKRRPKTTIKPDHYERLRSETHVLYRCYNRSKLLLYVGMTNNPELRFKHHRADKIWWKYVDRITLEDFATRRELIEAEAEAIHSEKPKFNIAYPMGAKPDPNPGRRGDKPLWGEPSTFGTVIHDHILLINQTIERQRFPCVECEARAIYCEGDTVGCELCSAKWTFDQWFEMTFKTTRDTPPGIQMTLM